MLTIHDVTCLSSRLLCLAGLLVFPLAGCSDLGTEGAGGDAGSGATGGAAGGSGEGGTSGSGGTGAKVPMFQTVFHWTPGSISGVGIEGAKICEDGTDNCELTNAEGKAVLYLPPNQEVAISIEKEGYGLLLNADVTDETFFSAPNDPLYTHEILEAVAADLGVEYPWQGGVVRFVRGPVSTGVSGVTFEPVGASVGQVGDPVYYDTATERYSRDLEATTGVLQAWSLPISDGGFVDVPPGVHEFEYGGAAGDCTLSFGWPGSGLNRLRLPVRDGYITYGSMGCE